MYIILILFIIILFVILYFTAGVKFTTEQFTDCCKEKGTCALMAPNIPVDPKTSYKICGKYCNQPSENNLAPNNGNYIFPIPKLLYDGIWDNNRKIYDDKEIDIEVQKWGLTRRIPTNGKYATNKFFHLPAVYLAPGQKACDPSMYWNNREILETYDRGDVRDNRDPEIAYWPAGVGSQCVIFP